MELFSNYYRQRYWDGPVWAPLIFLVYIGLRNYDLPEVRNQLAEKLRQLFVKNWKKNFYVGENYCDFDGLVNNPAIKSVPFYTWGSLLGMIGIMKEEYMPATETIIK